MLLLLLILNSFELFFNAMKMFMSTLPLLYNALHLWECPLNLKQTMNLHIEVVDLNSFVKNILLFMSLASLKIHMDKLLLKGHIEL
jgi:hypothetical protein